ncbi:MAG: hypothetical protein ACLFSQ_08490 [Candidatus Zixiibacteriota bacterium]
MKHDDFYILCSKKRKQALQRCILPGITELDEEKNGHEETQVHSW